jgi:hypothetical protein
MNSLFPEWTLNGPQSGKGHASGLSRAPWSPVVLDSDALMPECTINFELRALAMSGDQR